MLQRLGPLGRLRPVLDAPDGERLAAGLRLSHELTSRQREQVTAIRTRRTELAALRKARQEREQELVELRTRARAERKRLTRTIRDRRALLRRIREERSLREQALAELERARGALAEILAGATPPRDIRLDVRQFRGLLPMPAKARVSVGFGDRRDPRFGTVIPHPGWDVEAKFGAKVKAPFEAKVVFADWFRGYGLVVVLDHGHGLHSVFAHLSAILVEPGERVEQRDVVGRVGDTGSLRGPFLYMELRESGKAVDPALWIDRDSR